ncbi:unnamed protein product [Kluyveromyces dobzhanskii CBS 2104]|uniref:WGS project CCBQ000000000 data, contig 00011 n=1 Tax=Kluyveromyces dobzhanskii CBS 2104 TaxID=1427455 RepID=A0A0A8LA43_9SACH|nr:unnamed protein product [Kluyveromyces dobzhanskii CBS 2104]
MSYPENFQGFAVVEDHKNWLKPEKVVYPAKNFNSRDVDIEIEACGVCGSDVHCANGNWGNMKLPLVVGHEIIGKVVRLGDECDTGLKLGDRVGVGAQVSSCLDCSRCSSDNEQYCPKFVTTYSQPYFEDGYVSQGGYASHVRVHEHFVLPIPEALETKNAAPLLCGGATVFSPLKRNGCGPGQKVGIVGIGGIGHMGILLAKAMGAEVYAISRSHAKEEAATELGADHYIATEDEGWETKYFDTLDSIVLCGNSLTGIDFNKLPKILKVNGKLTSISVPAQHESLKLHPMQLLGYNITQSALASRAELIEMLNLVADNNIKLWVETLPISQENIGQAFERMESGDVRFRFTFTDFDKQFGEFKAKN